MNSFYYNIIIFFLVSIGFILFFIISIYVINPQASWSIGITHNKVDIPLKNIMDMDIQRISAKMHRIIAFIMLYSVFTKFNIQDMTRVCYQVPCVECQMKYVGHTKRKLCTRVLKEHEKSCEGIQLTSNQTRQMIIEFPPIML